MVGYCWRECVSSCVISNGVLSSATDGDGIERTVAKHCWWECVSNCVVSDDAQQGGIPVATEPGLSCGKMSRPMSVRRTYRIVAMARFAQNRGLHTRSLTALTLWTKPWRYLSYREHRSMQRWPSYIQSLWDIIVPFPGDTTYIGAHIYVEQTVIQVEASLRSQMSSPAFCFRRGRYGLHEWV